MKHSMFWNWFRWQCLNTSDYYGAIPKGTLIDEDEFTVQVLKLISVPIKSVTYKHVPQNSTFF